MIEKTFDIQHQNMTIRGFCYLPTDTGRHPTLLLFHGLGGNHIEHTGLYLKLAQFFTDRSYAVISFNFRNTPISDGSLDQMLPTDELSDALRLCQWTAAQPFVDRSRLALVAISMGGLISAATMPRLTDNPFKAWVLLNPTDVPNLCRVVDEKNTPAGQPFKYGSNRMRPEFCDDLRTLDPLTDALAFKGPTLLIQGAKDGIVPPQVSIQYHDVRKSAGLPVETRLIENGDHPFQGDDVKQHLYQTMADWLDPQML